MYDVSYITRGEDTMKTAILAVLALATLTACGSSEAAQPPFSPLSNFIGDAYTLGGQRIGDMELDLNQPDRPIIAFRENGATWFKNIEFPASAKHIKGSELDLTSSHLTFNEGNSYTEVHCLASVHATMYSKYEVNGKITLGGGGSCGAARTFGFIAKNIDGINGD